MRKQETPQEWIERNLPFIHKPRELWTEDERIEFNATMDALFTARAMSIHAEITARRKENS